MGSCPQLAEWHTLGNLRSHGHPKWRICSNRRKFGAEIEVHVGDGETYQIYDGSQIRSNQIRARLRIRAGCQTMQSATADNEGRPNRPDWCMVLGDSFFFALASLASASRIFA